VLREGLYGYSGHAYAVRRCVQKVLSDPPKLDGFSKTLLVAPPNFSRSPSRRGKGLFRHTSVHGTSFISCIMFGLSPDQDPPLQGIRHAISEVFWRSGQMSWRSRRIPWRRDRNRGPLWRRRTPPYLCDRIQSLRGMYRRRAASFPAQPESALRVSHDHGAATRCCTAYFDQNIVKRRV
jgi:hypothetical protein